MLSATTDPSTPKAAKAKPIALVSPTGETGTAISPGLTFDMLKGISTSTPPATVSPRPSEESQTAVQAEIRSWVKTSRDQRKYRDTHCGAIKVDGIPAIDMAEENRVNEMRHRKLVGKTINGTFTRSNRGRHHWIRWNSNKCDNVRVPTELAYEIFKGEPQTGVRVRCLITGLSPENVTAWRKNPQCETFEIKGNYQLCPNQSDATRSSCQNRFTMPTSLPGRLPSLRSDFGSPTWTRRTMTCQDRLDTTNRSTTPVGSVSSPDSSHPFPASRSRAQRSVLRQVRQKQYITRQYLNCDMGSWRSRHTQSRSPRLSASLKSLAEVGSVKRE